MPALAIVTPSDLKIDLGCGTRKREGYVGVDILPFEGVDIVANLNDRWPWEDGTVAEAAASHVVEHLTTEQRCHFANELHRVLVPGGKCLIAYGDPTHVWPPVSEFWFYYLNAAWRKTEAPHTEHLFSCDFHASWGYQPHPDLLVKSTEYQQHALQNFKEAALDMVATLTKNQ
jgi:predicted SAM-dependent methyltransferase